MQALKDLTHSKKAIVYVVTAAVMAAVVFGGIEPAAADSFLDKLYKLAMAYLGGQGLADLGKYAGEAYASGKKAIETRDPEQDVPVSDAAAVGASAAEKAQDITDRIEVGEEGKGE